jgi:hypothetical protein
METIKEKVQLAKETGTHDVSIVHASIQKDLLLVWNACGILKVRSFHRPPLHKVRVSDRENFLINSNMNGIQWIDGTFLTSPFIHAGSCYKAHPQLTHNQFLKEPEA